MPFCLTAEFVEKMKQAIKSGKLNPEKLNNMTSAERRNFLADIIGKETAEQVNLLFEKKTLLKNQERAMYDWAREITGLSKAEKEATLAKIKQTFADKDRRLYEPKENENFLNEITSDIYSKKYKTEVSLEEAQTITEMAQDLKVAKEQINPDFTWKSEEGKFKAGASERALVNYTNSLKSEATKKGLINPFKETGIGNKAEAMIENSRISTNFIAQTSRGIVAGIADNSFWGNQGIKVLWYPKTTRIWAKDFFKSFIDIGKILTSGVKKGEEIRDGVYADYYTRQNRLNGKYNAKIEGGGKIDKRLDIGTGEEEISTDVMTKLGQIPIISKIPILKQGFELVARGAKAANVAYEAGAMRLRMDVADKYYEWSEKAGKDMTNNHEVGSINTVINSLTGRGGIGAFEKAGKQINWVVFSVKFAKSNIDFLTAHWLDPNISVNAKIIATKNLLTVVSMIGTTLVIAKTLDPNSTDLDLRSSKLGKIYGQDITGGMASYLTLTSRIATQATKSSTTGIVSPLGNGYGQMNGVNIFEQFLENKTSPIATVVKDLMKQETFNKKKPTLLTELQGLTTPIGVSNTIDIYNEKNSNLLLMLIGSGLNLVGFNKNVYTSSIDWGESAGKELLQLKTKVGDVKFQEVNNKFNQQYNDWLNSIKNNPDYQNLSAEEQQKVLTDKKSNIKDQIFKEYHFNYKQEKTKPNRIINKLTK